MPEIMRRERTQLGLLCAGRASVMVHRHCAQRLGSFFPDGLDDFHRGEILVIEDVAGRDEGAGAWPTEGRSRTTEHRIDYGIGTSNPTVVLSD
jgi:hypothetical protein